MEMASIDTIALVLGVFNGPTSKIDERAGGVRRPHPSLTRTVYPNQRNLSHRRDLRGSGKTAFHRATSGGTKAAETSVGLAIVTVHVSPADFVNGSNFRVDSGSVATI